MKRRTFLPVAQLANHPGMRQDQAILEQPRQGRVPTLKWSTQIGVSMRITTLRSGASALE